MEFLLSDQQKRTKNSVNRMIDYCKGTLKEQDISINIEKSSSKELKIENDHQSDKGMGR